MWITVEANETLASALPGGENNEDFDSFRSAFCYLARMRRLTNSADVSRSSAQELISDLEDVYEGVSLGVKDVQDICYGVQSY